MRQIRSEKLRQQLLELMGGQIHLQHFVYNLNNMVHAPAIADWLLRRGLKGEVLVEWLKEKHQDSFLKAMKHIVADVNGRPEQPILVGRDYRTRNS
jgi:hypothetical protein